MIEQWTKVVPGHLGFFTTVASLMECDVLLASLGSFWAANKCHFINTAQNPWACVKTAYQTYCLLTPTFSCKSMLPTFPLPLWLCFDWLWMMSLHCLLFLSEGKDLRVTWVSTSSQVTGETLCMDLEPWCNHLLWAYDAATQWNSNCAFFVIYNFPKFLFTLGPSSWTTFLSLVFELYC